MNALGVVLIVWCVFGVVLALVLGWAAHHRRRLLRQRRDAHPGASWWDLSD